MQRSTGIIRGQHHRDAWQQEQAEAVHLVVPRLMAVLLREAKVFLASAPRQAPYGTLMVFSICWPIFTRCEIIWWTIFRVFAGAEQVEDHNSIDEVR